jgi:hypothetical protein
MNIDEEIKCLEDQQEVIQDKLDELYDIKHKENTVFRDNLVGKCFKDGTRYIKVIKRFDNSYSFETFEFDTKFHGKENAYETPYNTFDYSDKFIQEADYFDNEEEITNEEYMVQFDKLVEKIKNNIIS